MDGSPHRAYRYLLFRKLVGSQNCRSVGVLMGATNSYHDSFSCVFDAKCDHEPFCFSWASFGEAF
jgi:hypothetical protein